VAIAFVQEVDSGAVVGATVTTRTVTYATGPTNGNLLVATALACHSGAGLTITTAGWTQAFEVAIGATTLRMQVWYKIAGASEGSTVTATTTGGARLSLWAAEYSGVDSTTPVDVFVVNWASADTFTGMPGYPAKIRGLVLHCFASDDSGAGQTPTWVAFYGNESEAQRGATFSHRTSGADTQGHAARVYEKIRTGTTEGPAGAGVDFDTITAAEQLGATIIFRESGAANASAVTSGAGTGAFVQSKTASSAAAGGSIDATLTTDPTVGNLLLAAISWQDATTPGDDTITPPTGWTQIDTYKNAVKTTASRRALFGKIAVSGEDTGAISFTFSANNSLRSLMIAEYSGPVGTGVPVVDAVWHQTVYGENTSTDTGASTYYGSRGTVVTTTDNIEIAFGFCDDIAFLMPVAGAQGGWSNRRATVDNNTQDIGLVDHFSATAGGVLWRTLEGTTAGTPSVDLDVVLLVFAVGVTDGDTWGWHDGEESWAVV